MTSAPIEGKSCKHVERSGALVSKKGCAWYGFAAKDDSNMNEHVVAVDHFLIGKMTEHVGNLV